MILEQFDPSKKAIINPSDIHKEQIGFPDTIVSVFSHILFERIVKLFNAEMIARTKDVDGFWDVYEIKYEGHAFAFAKARLGAPACVGTFEDILAMGGKRIVLVGNCGVLDKDISDCGIIIPTRAIRDEGTSFHYAPPSDYIDVNKKHIDLFKSICDRYGYSYREGTTWTTDAFYRETPMKVQNMSKLGAICVEMECSAMQALCDFRGVEFFQFLYAADSLANTEWEPRSLSGTVRLDDKEKIATLAFELALKIELEQN